MRYREFLKARLKWASRGPWALVEKISALSGFVISICVYFATDWSKKNIDERMNALLLGIIPLAVGFSVFLVRWLASPWFVYQALATSHKKEISTLRNELKGKEDIIEQLTEDGAHFELEESAVEKRGSDYIAQFSFLNTGNAPAEEIAFQCIALSERKAMTAGEELGKDDYIHAKHPLNIPWILKDFTEEASCPEIYFRMILTYKDKRSGRVKEISRDRMWTGAQSGEFDPKIRMLGGKERSKMQTFLSVALAKEVGVRLPERLLDVSIQMHTTPFEMPSNGLQIPQELKRDAADV